MSCESPTQPEVKPRVLATKSSLFGDSPRIAMSVQPVQTIKSTPTESKSPPAKIGITHGKTLGEAGLPGSSEEPHSAKKIIKSGKKTKKLKEQFTSKIDDICIDDGREESTQGINMHSDSAQSQQNIEIAPLLSTSLRPTRPDPDRAARSDTEQTGIVSSPTTRKTAAIKKKGKSKKKPVGSSNEPVSEPTSFFSGDEGDEKVTASKDLEPLGSDGPQVCGVVIGKPKALKNMSSEASQRPGVQLASKPSPIFLADNSENKSVEESEDDRTLERNRVDPSTKKSRRDQDPKENANQAPITFVDRFRTVRNPQVRRGSTRSSVRPSGMRETIRTLTHEEWIDRYIVPLVMWYQKAVTATVLKCFCIFGSIFFPDLWILWQVPDNISLDIILTLIFFVFLFEFIITSLTDASYFFSMFAVMDAISSLSMITDVSYLLGVSATDPQEIDAADLSANSDVLLKLTRMARLVTRVGRLTRTSKALWFFVGEVEKREQSKMLRVMGHQLRQTLSMRLSMIMFCCVFVSPTTLMFVYPVADESIVAWTTILSQDSSRYFAANNSQMAAMGTRLASALNDFAKFYDRADYGPFTVCFRPTVGSPWQCKPDALPDIAWTVKDSTKRKGSWWVVSVDNFQATYDMSSPEQIEAVGSIGLIISVTLCLLGFSVTLQHGVTRLALKPLERMLSVVRYNCGKIFQYAADIESELDADFRKENFDCNENTNESALLEAVIDKLVIVCERAVARLEPVKKVAETDEDRLVLFFQNANKADAGEMKAENSYSSSSNKARQQRRGSLLTKWQGTSGVPLEVLTTLDSNTFNALDIPADALRAVAFCLMVSSNGCGEFIKSEVEEPRLSCFLRAVQNEYPANPFHNFNHAVDVLATVSRHMLRGRALKFLSEAQQFVVLISAISHDLGHLGVNNSYLLEVSHELALTYNDLSPLENMHCAKLFNITADSEQNIFSKISKANKGSFKAMRKEIIESILATDVSEYKKLKEKTQLFYELNHWELEKGAMTNSVRELLRKESQTFQNLYLQVADTSGPTKPWDLCQRYANLIMEEGFAQGDAERKGGLLVLPLNNRKRVCKASYQVGWIDLVVLPMTEVMIRIFPPLENIAEHIDGNFQNWVDRLKQETRLTKDEAAKLQERTKKVFDKCEAMRTNRSWASLPDLEEEV